MFITDPSDQPKMMALFNRAMEIWVPTLPDIQLVQNFHRIPMNHVLEKLANQRKSLRQWRAMAPDFPNCAKEFTADVIAPFEELMPCCAQPAARMA
jgi:hypothetical protein